MLFCTTGRVVYYENTPRQTVMKYKFTALEFVLYYHILCIHAIPTYRVYQLYDKW